MLKAHPSVASSLPAAAILAAFLFITGCAQSPQAAAPPSSVTTTLTVPTKVTTHSTTTVLVPTTTTVVSSTTVTATITQAVAAPEIAPENAAAEPKEPVQEQVAPPVVRALVDVPAPSVNFANCTEARAAGAAPVRRGDPGYSSKLDRDNDGVGCE